MSLSEFSLSQTRKDLQYLRDNYGDVSDFCGTFCNCRVLEGILNGTSSVKDTIISYIEYYFSNGVLINDCYSTSSDIMPDINDKRVQRIIERYIITPSCNKCITKDGEIYNVEKEG